MSLSMHNPLAIVGDEQLEDNYEKQHKALAEAIRSGNLERAKQMQQALSDTESELKSRGLHGGSLDRIHA